MSELDPLPLKPPPLVYHFQEDCWHIHEPAIQQDFPKLLATIQHQLPLTNTHFMVDLTFIDDDEMAEINHTYRQKNKATNVLSFPHPPLTQNGKTVILGDVLFSYTTIANEAITQHKSFAHHLNHLFVHGLLHLLGHDHQREADATIMESLEIKILAQHTIPNPYQEKE